VKNFLIKNSRADLRGESSLEKTLR